MSSSLSYKFTYPIYPFINQKEYYELKTPIQLHIPSSEHYIIKGNGIYSNYKNYNFE